MACVGSGRSRVRSGSWCVWRTTTGSLANWPRSRSRRGSSVARWLTSSRVPSRRNVVARELFLNTQTEGLQCFKRWCCRLLERCVVFLHGAQGFPQSPSHFQSDFPKCIENAAFVARLRFRARQQLSINTVHSLENQVVASANQSNRTV